MRDADVRAGMPVTMNAVRWYGRQGTVRKPSWTDAGGAGMRMCWIVALRATDRAVAREVRCYAASFEPIYRGTTADGAVTT